MTRPTTSPSILCATLSAYSLYFLLQAYVHCRHRCRQQRPRDSLRQRRTVWHDQQILEAKWDFICRMEPESSRACISAYKMTYIHGLCISKYKSRKFDSYPLSSSDLPKSLLQVIKITFVLPSPVVRQRDQTQIRKMSMKESCEPLSVLLYKY